MTRIAEGVTVSELATVIMRRTLVISKVSSSCGNCGHGGYMCIPYSETERTKCLGCETVWTYSVYEYEQHDDMEAKADMEYSFPGMEFIGYGSGSLFFEDAIIHRLLAYT